MIYLNGYIKETKWIIWEIEETEQTLWLLLGEHHDAVHIKNIKSETRRKEKIVSRIILKLLLGDSWYINYKSSGKPFLTNSRSKGQYNISISHTKSFVMVAINKSEQCTIDIEQYSNKVEKVRSKFINENEHSNINSLNNDSYIYHLLIHWTAKEAMYKFVDNTEVDFKKHFEILRLTQIPKSNWFTCKEMTQKKHRFFDAFYYYDKNFVMSMIWEKAI